jgi:hypothetical protein
MGFLEEALEGVEIDAVGEIVMNHKNGGMAFHVAYDILLELELEPDVALNLLFPPMDGDDWSTGTHSTKQLGHKEEE